MIMKLGIVVGHEQKEPGAEMATPFNAITEYEYNTILSGVIKAIAMRKNLECGVFFRDIIGIHGAYEEAKKWGASGIIELHFNAYQNDEARGTETLYGQIIGSDKLADYVHNQIIIGLARPKKQDRGLKNISTEDRGGKNLNNQTGIPSILVEPFFGSNPDDCLLALECIPELAESIVNGFMYWFLGCVKDCKDVH